MGEPFSDTSASQTAATLTFAVYLLCLYPDVLKRLRAEIMDKIGPTHTPTFDDIKTMKYLRAVLNGRRVFACDSFLCSHLATETLRLYPAVYVSVICGFMRDADTQ